MLLLLLLHVVVVRGGGREVPDEYGRSLLVLSLLLDVRQLEVGGGGAGGRGRGLDDGVVVLVNHRRGGGGGGIFQQVVGGRSWRAEKWVAYKKTHLTLSNTLLSQHSLQYKAARSPFSEKVAGLLDRNHNIS